jgi:hypothetical protein
MPKKLLVLLNRKLIIILSVLVFVCVGFSTKVNAASSVQIWNGTAWTTTFSSGSPIDTGVASNALSQQIATDSTGKVYTVFQQSSHVYLSRYDGTDVRIWNGTAWTTTMANGAPIDNGTANAASSPQLAIDSTNKVYITYIQSNGVFNRVLLSRYDGTDVRIWDGNASAWTTTMANGTPIDPASTNNTGSLQIATDSTGKVYVTFTQGLTSHVYLSRYDGTDVRIWDNGASTWTTTFANGDPIDTGTANSASEPQLAIDSTGKVYVIFVQGATSHLYLSRYDGTDVRIWDNGASTWTTTFANGDPIDTGTANSAYSNQIATDSTGKVYIVYQQSDGANLHVYLSRYDGTDVRIWDNGASTWTTTFANGDPVDTGTAQNAITPQVAVDLNNKVYVTYYQSDGTKQRIYLSRYDGTNVGIWDNGTSTWTTTFANGDPIDRHQQTADSPQLAIDSTGNVYVTFRQSDGVSPKYNEYLSRYDGTNVGIWDGAAVAWTTTFANGTPIDLGIGVSPSTQAPQLAIDSTGNVYVNYSEVGGSNFHVYLSRYDVPVTHAITASAGSNGTISPTGATSVSDGGSQAYTITPSSGYHVADVLVDSVSAGAVTSYAFTGVTTTHTISATFAIDVVASTTSTGSSTGGTVFGCKDPNASNYDRFVASRPSLCIYNSTSEKISVLKQQLIALITQVIQLLTLKLEQAR